MINTTPAPPREKPPPQKKRGGLFTLTLTLLILTSCQTTINLTIMTKKKTEINLPRFRNHYNYKHHISDIETVTGESQTEPGQSLTIKEILERFTTGIPLPESEMHFDENATLDTDTTFRDPDRDLTHLDDKVNQEFEEMRIKKTEEKQSDSSSNASTEKAKETPKDLSDQGSNVVDDPESDNPK